MKNLFLLLLSIGLHQQSNAQVNVFNGGIDQPVTAVPYAQFNAGTPATISGGNILLGNTSGYNYTQTTSKSVIANQKIRTLSTADFKPSGSGSLRLAICSGNQGIFYYGTDDLNSIEALTKFELGIQLPTEIQTSINNFNTTGDSNLYLNPFLEWDVNVKATFTHNQTGFQKQVYGYYSNDFERQPNVNWELASWNRLPTVHPFRIRNNFPEKTGMWTVKVQLWVNGALYTDYCAFNVNVVPNTHGDAFVKVGDNKKTFTKNGELFFAIGQNLIWPETNETQSYSCFYDIYGLPCESTAHTAFEAQIDNYAANGTNTFRMLLNPGSLDIEFEKVGNYYDRLNYAWEIDNIIQQAERNNLYIDFNMLLHQGFAIGSAYGALAWDWGLGSPYNAVIATKEYCYSKDLGLATPNLFLTDVKAKKFYKQKLRYLISRYGYSTNIFLFELISEINQVGDIFDLTTNERTQTQYGAVGDGNPAHTTHRQNTYLWQKEMAEYIKNTLNHKDHMLSCSYAGPPASDDPTFGIPELDVMSYNSYPYRFDHMDIFINEINQYWNQYQKPIFMSETGPIHAHTCDNGLTYQKHAWQIGLSGVAGLNMWMASGPSGSAHWPELVKVKNWIQNDPQVNYAFMHDFTSFQFNSTPFATDKYKKEISGIVGKRSGSSTSIILGCLNNLTDNYYTNTNPLVTTWCNDPTKSDNLITAYSGTTPYKTKQNMNWGDNPMQPIGWPGEFHHFLWYNPGNVSLYDQTTWEYGYDYYLQHPLSCITGGCLSDHPNTGVIPFKSDYSDYSSLRGGLKPVSAKINSFEVSLNPNPGISTLDVSVLLNEETEFVNLVMLDATGRKVRSANNVINLKSFNTADLIPGIYYIQALSDKGEIQILKWVKAQY